MAKRAAGVVVLFAASLMTSAAALAEGVPELLAVCQNEETAAKTRVEMCTRLVDDKTIEADLRAEALLNRGVAREELGEDEAALADYTKAIELNAEYPAFFGYRGMLYEKLGRYDEAIKDSTEVLRLLPGDYDALHSRARSYYIVGNLKASLADYAALVSADPKDVDALVGRGSVYEDLGQKKEAVADFKAALKLDSANEDAKEGLARLNVK